MGKTIFSPRFTKFNPYHDRSSGRFTSGAGGASGGPVVVTTIDAAIALLGKGKGVMFTTPDKAVTLIHKLATIAQEARAKGEKAPVYDLCKVSVKGTNLFCAENVGIPRSNMPQLRGKPNPGTPADNLPKDAKGEVDLGPAFRDFMYAQGHKIEDIQVPASHLRASQTELNGVKVAGMVISLEHNLLPPAPIFVSNENYVIDGHHRWAANVGYGLGEKKDMDMPISRLDMPILQALKMAGDFAASMGIPQAGIGKAGLNAQEYMVAFMLLTMATKFNPYHDRTSGRFASGGTGVANPTQLGQALIPAEVQTRSQVEIWFDEQHPRCITRFDGATDEAAREVAEQVHYEMQKYPAMERTLEYLGTWNDVPEEVKVAFRNTHQIYETIPTYMKLNGSMALTFSYSDASGFHQAMIFNTEKMHDPINWGIDIIKAENDGWFRERKLGVPPATYIAAHECGHAEYNALIARTQGGACFSRYKDGDFGDTQKTIQQWADTHTLEMYDVSHYATQNGPREAMAEAHQQSQYAADPSALAGQYERMMAVMHDTGGNPKQIYNAVDLKNIPDEQERIAAQAELNSYRKQLGLSLVDYSQKQAELWDMSELLVVDWLEKPYTADHTEEELKFNPYHDRSTGRFASSGLVQAELPGMPEKVPPYTIQQTLEGMERPPGVPPEVNGIEEICAFMEDEHPGIQFAFDLSNEKEVREICDSLDRQLKAYPDVAKQMHFVGTPKSAPQSIDDHFQETEGMSAEAYMGDAAYACTGSHEIDGHLRTFMLFNPVFTGNTPHWNESYANDVAHGWAREAKPGLTPAQVTTVHEFGHAIWATIIAKYGETGGLIPYKDGDFGTMKGTVDQWLQTHRDRAMNISGYGLEGGPREAIAEGYSQITQAVHPGLFSGDVKKLFNLAMPNGQAQVYANPVDISTLSSAKEITRAQKQINALKRKLGIPI